MNDKEFSKFLDKKYKDDQLPDKNWDDYYVQVIEAAVGIRS